MGALGSSNVHYLELSEVVADIDHLGLEVVSLHEEVEQLLGVPALLDLPGHLGVNEDLQHGLRLALAGERSRIKA